MNDRESNLLSSKIDAGVKAAVAEAIERHRKLGQSIAIWRDRTVIIIPADKIPPLDSENNIESSS